VIRLYGQAPSRTSGKPFSGKSGKRLAKLAGMTHDEFLRTFKCKNLLDEYPGSKGKGDSFDALKARERAIYELMKWKERDVIILCGRKVASAFRREEPYCEWTGRIVVIPHPSGANYLWNDPNTGEKVARVLREAVERSSDE